ncbi:SMI1/KNR4 family protein [Paenibacillus pinihumi]|uniref:SMI1/KNR4 family protein n=1 Tax=Paenibacillus pinihumi TaxID=669462 RepID=UPI00048E5D05|nr:SMI1/KNR4 family protein [Paenibacillus pinihumi]
MIQNHIHQFKKRLETNNGCTEIIIPGGDSVNVRSHFNPPAAKQDIQRLTNYFSSQFPNDYLQFLECCNGASLFEDLQYGGENILYSVEQVIFLNDISRQQNQITVANILDDRIVIDLNLWRKGEDHYLLLCESQNPVEISGKFFCDFETWLERFIIAQGNKYWYWKTERK